MIFGFRKYFTGGGIGIIQSLQTEGLQLLKDG